MLQCTYLFLQLKRNLEIIQKLQPRVVKGIDQNDSDENLAETLNWLPVWASFLQTCGSQFLLQVLKSPAEI